MPQKPSFAQFLQARLPKPVASHPSYPVGTPKPAAPKMPQNFLDHLLRKTPQVAPVQLTPQQEAAIKAMQKGTSAEYASNFMDFLLGTVGLADEGTSTNPNMWARGGAALGAIAPLGAELPFLEKAPGLYSRVERAVDMIPKKGAKAESVLNLMQKAPGGLNPEELAWRKVPRFLEAQRGKVVTPDVMMEHLKSNPLDVSVKNLTPVDPATRHEYDKAIENIWSFRDRLRARNGSELLPDFRSPFPGNDFVNFETNVFDAAAGRVDAINWLRKQGVSESELSSLINEARIVNETSNQLANPSRYGEHGELPLVIPGGNDYRETLLTLGGPNDRFYSAHFDEPNILVHTRSNTRKLPSAGGPGRFLEEVQSDWHQLGKKNGYGPGGEVPDAPFKESWPDLALKQQLYETARDPEARWLGFTPGITQERRYSKLYQEDFPNDGMRKFYDQLLPKRLEKIVKPFGGRVSEWTMPFIEEYNAPGWLVRLTPEMKQRILQQGLPLLSLGGLAMTAGQEAEKNRGK